VLFYVASLDSDAGQTVSARRSKPAYQQGYLLYLRGTTLVAQPFDEKRLEIYGSAFTLAEACSPSQHHSREEFWRMDRAGTNEAASSLV